LLLLDVDVRMEGWRSRSQVPYQRAHQNCHSANTLAPQLFWRQPGAQRFWGPLSCFIEGGGPETKQKAANEKKTVCTISRRGVEDSEAGLREINGCPEQPTHRIFEHLVIVREMFQFLGVAGLFGRFHECLHLDLLMPLSKRIDTNVPHPPGGVVLAKLRVELFQVRGKKRNNSYTILRLDRLG